MDQLLKKGKRTSQKILVNKERIGSRGNKKRQVNQRFNPQNKDYLEVQGWLQVIAWKKGGVPPPMTTYKAVTQTEGPQIVGDMIWS